MAEQDREITITIRGKNLAEADFKAAAAGALGLNTEIKKVSSSAQGSTTSFNGMTGALGATKKALGALGITAAAVGFARSILRDADALVELHEKTGISVRGLQILQVAGDDAGNTIDELTTAVSFMQRSIGGNDAPFLQALRELGINVEHLRRLSPDEQFIAIGDALKGVTDPAKQVDLAVATLGRTGAIVLPTMKRGFDDLKDSAVGMSDEAVFAFDAVGDAIGRATRVAKAGATEWVTGIFRPWIQHWQLATEAAKLYEDQLAFIKRAVTDPAMRPGLAKPFMIGIPSEADQKRLASEAEGHLRTLEQQREANEKKAATDRIKRAADEREYWNFIGERQREDAAATRAFFAWYEDARKRELAMVSQTFDITKKTAGVWDTMASRDLGQQFGMQGLVDTNREVFETTEDWRDALFEVVDALGVVGDRWSTVAAGILRQSQAIVSIWQGDASKGIKGNKTAAIGMAAGAAGQFIPTGTTAGKIASGAAQGAAVGSIFGPVGLGVGAGVGALVGWLQSQKAHKQVNDLRDAFIAAAGGLGRLNEKAYDAGLSLEAMLKADTVEEYQAAIEELTDSLEFQDQAMQFLEDTMAKYGLTVQDMGDKFQQQNLDEQAANLVMEFRALEAAGASVEVISGKMSEAINAYVQNALAAGTTVPAAMHDIIQQMITQGLLLDENGEAFENLEDTGLTFAETLEGAVGSLIDEIKRLVEAITRGLGGAIANIPSVNVPVHWDLDPFPDMPEMPGHARGGVFSQPHAAWIAEGGRPELVGDEDFVTRSLVRAFEKIGHLGASAVSGASAPIVVQLVLDGQVIDRHIINTGQRALYGGQWAVPVRAMVQRYK